MTEAELKTLMNKRIEPDDLIKGDSLVYQLLDSIDWTMAGLRDTADRIEMLKADAVSAVQRATQGSECLTVAEWSTKYIMPIENLIEDLSNRLN